MGCIGSLASGVTKIILFVFNFIIFLCGVLLIVVGGIALSNTFKYDVNSVAIFAIVLGVIIALISFCGCCGVIQQSRCLLTTYAVILLIIFVIQIVLAVVAFVTVKEGSTDFTDSVSTYLNEIYTNYWSDSTSRDIVNAFQISYQCCGLNGPTGSEVVNRNGTGLIESCCESSTTTCTTSTAFTKGCLSLLEDTIRTLFHYSGGIAIGFGVVELVSAIFAFCVRPRD